MAITVRLVLEPVAGTPEDLAISTLVDRIDGLSDVFDRLGGEIVGLERRVDLAPPAVEPTP